MRALSPGRTGILNNIKQEQQLTNKSWPRLFTIYELAAADLTANQALILVEGQFDLQSLEAAPLAHQCLAAVIGWFPATLEIDAQIVLQVDARLDRLTTTIAFNGHPVDIGRR